MSLQHRKFGLAAAAFAFAVFTLAATAEVRQVGEKVGDAPLVPIAKIVADPDAWSGKEVKVQGKVHGVCKMAGCWLELEEAGAKIRVKVDDGFLVFPEDSVGETAIARGTVKLIELDREQYIGWAQHEAEEEGKTFDEKTLGPGPYRIVQIAGIGAAIGE